MNQLQIYLLLILLNKIIVDKLKIEKLTVGYDFHFGKNREGRCYLNA